MGLTKLIYAEEQMLKVNGHFTFWIFGKEILNYLVKAFIIDQGNST